MIKDILFPIAETAAVDVTLKAAIALAEKMEAHLTILQGTHFPLPPPTGWGAIPDPMFFEAYMDIRAAAAKKNEELHARMRHEPISWEIRQTEDYSTDSADSAALQAYYCDLSIMSACDEGAPDWNTLHTLFNFLLRNSGRPILTIPEEGAPPQWPARHAVVCWEPSRSSTRALHDALPLLRLAETVDILHIEEKIGRHTDGALPGYSVALHLQRHGIEAQAIGKSRPTNSSTSTMLLTHAHQTGAGLIVAGGYGHSRVREWAIGGTTRELLSKAGMPVLFSH